MGGKDLRIDYFLPSTHEERFMVGYKKGGAEKRKYNFENNFQDTSSGAVASAKTEGKFDDLKLTQTVSLGENDFFFRTKVVVKNVGGHTLNDVRYGRSCDPDNTVDMGGSYTTENKIKTTFTAVDKRAVPSYGNSGLYPNKGVFSNEVNTPHAKNKSHKKDAWIGMFVKFGNMAPGAENTFYFDTWMAESKVVIDEAAVAKASVSIAKVAASEGCAAIPCPAKSTGPDVRSGCKCNKSGKVTPTKSAP